MMTVCDELDRSWKKIIVARYKKRFRYMFEESRESIKISTIRDLNP